MFPRAFPGQSHGAERGPRQHLTVPTVADYDLLGVDLGIVRDVPAMAAPIDLHKPVP